jgi:hypothetical protein
MRMIATAAALAAFAFALPAAAQQRSAEEEAFRAIYQELVEIDTSPTTGNCTRLVYAS